MSTDKRTGRRRKHNTAGKASGSRNAARNGTAGNRSAARNGTAGNRSAARNGTAGNRSAERNSAAGSRNAARNSTNRVRANAASGNRRETGRGMTRQQRQKQLMMHLLIAAVVIAAAVLVLVAVVRAGHGGKQSAEVSQSAATVQKTETEQVSAEAGSQEAVTEQASAEADPQNAETDPGTNTSVGEGTAAANLSDTSGSIPGAGTQTAEAAAEVTKEESGPGMADQSLVEKLSVEAKKNLETEKARLAKEEEERQRQAEEEARKAEVKDRDELSQISIDELAEYLRNKEVPEELITFMEEYPEAREFVTDYLYQPETPPSKDISGEVVRGHYPHFLQWDKRWGYEIYGGSFFAVAGCGPTALSVVYSGLTGKTDMNPYAMSQWAEEQGYYIVGEGTSWEMMWRGAADLGLYAWEVDFDEFTITSTLQNGFPIIAAMSPGGDFTTFGHFIVLTDIDDEGNVTIRDSNSIERTERTWTLDELLWQTAAMWGYNYDDGTYY